jgi:hypothetical protein
VRALENGQLSAAVAAIKEKGVLSGKRIERAEVGAPGEFDASAILQVESGSVLTWDRLRTSVTCAPVLGNGWLSSWRRLGYC